MYNAIQHYQKVETQSAVFAADPHRLIQMLLQGALDKVALARGHMERGEVAAKGKHISWAISIIEGLRSSLDKEQGGEIAQNLDSLYDYMERRLLLANMENNPAVLSEVSALLRDIKEAWDGIGTTVRAPAAPAAKSGTASVSYGA